jgi:group I intron endonuclease
MGCSTAARCSSFNSNCGIYALLNTVTGKRYVGSSVNIARRWRIHLSDLRNNEHHSVKLQRSWNKHGELAFKFEVLLNCTRDSLAEYEEKFMVIYDVVENGYNIERLTKGRHVASKETRQKLALVWKGRKHTPESRALMSRNKRGVALSAAHRAALRGVTRKNTTKIRESKSGAKNPNFGKPRSEETRERIATAQRGVPRPRHSEVTKQRMRDAHARRIANLE